MSLTSVLRRWHLLDPFNRKEARRAEIENVLRDHDAAMNRVVASNDGIRESQGKLRSSIEYARSASEAVEKQPDAMAQFVHDMRSAKPRREMK